MTYGRTLQLTGRTLRELILAMGLLALVFLAFGHQPASAGAADPGFRFADGSVPVFCGDAPGEDAGAHGPCHACRVSAADLPPPPCDAKAAFTGFAVIAYPPVEPAMAHRVPHLLKASRAPPASV